MSEASDELEYPKGADKGAVYGPVPSSNTAVEAQDEYQSTTFGEVPNIPTTNVLGFVPYRGGEQHGVRFTHDRKTSTPEISHYQAEQEAFNNVVDPTITPRDLSPVPPIRVQVVNNPDLLKKTKARIRMVPINNTQGLVNLVGQDWNRTRLIITVYASVTSAIGWLKTKNDGNVTFDALRITANNTNSITLLDTTATTDFYFGVDPSQGPTDLIYVGVYTEYPTYDGESLGL